MPMETRHKGTMQLPECLASDSAGINSPGMFLALLFRICNNFHLFCNKHFRVNVHPLRLVLLHSGSSASQTLGLFHHLWSLQKILQFG